MKSVYISLIISPRGVACEANLWEIMDCESSDVVSFDLAPPPFKVNLGQPNLKTLMAHLLLVLEVCDVKRTYRKSWAKNLLMSSDLTLGPFVKVKRG